MAMTVATTVMIIRAVDMAFISGETPRRTKE
jgi:hypothetical protein